LPGLSGQPIFVLEKKKLDRPRKGAIQKKKLYRPRKGAIQDGSVALWK
jgi:hypothetical protein